MASARRGSPVAIAVVSTVLAVLVAILVIGLLDGDDDAGRPVVRRDPDAEPEAPTGTAAVGEAAPTFTFEPVGGGEDVDFAEFRDGRPALVNFFARTCVPCVTEMPDLESTHQAHADDIAFLGLSYRESVEDARALVARTGVTYPTGRDPTGEVLARFGGVAMPTTVLIDAEGTVVAVLTGQRSRAELEEAVDDLLARTPP